MNNKESEDVQNIQQNNKLHYECHGKLVGGIDSGRAKPNSDKECRLVFTTVNYFSNDKTQIRTRVGATNLQNYQKRLTTLCGIKRIE